MLFEGATMDPNPPHFILPLPFALMGTIYFKCVTFTGYSSSPVEWVELRVIEHVSIATCALVGLCRCQNHLYIHLGTQTHF